MLIIFSANYCLFAYVAQF